METLDGKKLGLRQKLLNYDFLLIGNCIIEKGNLLNFSGRDINCKKKKK
jgi:hypothetical protein